METLIDYFQNEKGDYTITLDLQPIAVCFTEEDAIKLKKILESYQAIHQAILSAFKNLTTVHQENESLKEALEEALLQLEYLNKKYPATGTSNAVISHIQKALNNTFKIERI